MSRQCAEHKKPLEEDGTCRECTRLAAARVMTERAMQQIENLNNGDQQAKVIECGMRLRELAMYFGPYFRYALTLTACELASGDFVLPAEAECDRVDILLPGGRPASELRKLIVPGTKH